MKYSDYFMPLARLHRLPVETFTESTLKYFLSITNLSTVNRLRHQQHHVIMSTYHPGL